MKMKELWTPSARRFECLLKAAQNGDYDAYMSLMARFFKVMDDKARNNYLRDYEMFTALGFNQNLNRNTLLLRR